MPYANINDTVTLYYESLGDGHPLLLIHGFMGTGASEFPKLRDHLAKTYQVITPDLQGYGQSTPKPRRYGREFYRLDADDLVTLMAQLNLQDVIVMGYSDGGETALWLPILAPKRVKAVITWGATGHFDTSIKSAVLSMMSTSWHTDEMRTLHGAEHMQAMTHNWVHSMLQMIDDGGDITLSQAKTITCPVLIMLGDKDTLNPVVRGKAMADAIPNGAFTEFKNTGHGIHQERPRRFQREVRKFLRRFP